MLLESLEIHNFRNLSGKVSWGAGLNIIYGDNGQGKTNWLEAIYVLATTKSFRTQKLQESIRFGEDLAVVRGSVAESAEVHRELSVALQINTKSITVNGKRESVARYLSQLHTVSFTADDLQIVRGVPEARLYRRGGGRACRCLRREAPREPSRAAARGTRRPSKRPR